MSDDYSTKVNDIKSSEKTVMNQVRNFRDNLSSNTASIETNIKKSLDNHYNKIIKLEGEYNDNSKMKFSL
jgi:hypothetical protein